jgi:hypothetical protein
MRCAASLLLTSGATFPCVMEPAHVDSHLTIDNEGNLFRWDEPVEVTS